MCGGRIEGTTHGSINSPGYPGNYPLERDCEWTVVAPLGKRIQFHFAALRIESHQNCSFDYVEVWDGTRRASTNYLLARFCNSTTPAPVTSSGHIASVVFHSDDSVSDQGFHITWAAAPGE